MDNPELIQPGDRVFLALPDNLNVPVEEFVTVLDAYFPGVDFEAAECDNLIRPEIIFTYRDPRALDRWLAEQKIAEAQENGIGVTLA